MSVFNATIMNVQINFREYIRKTLSLWENKLEFVGKKPCACIIKPLRLHSNSLICGSNYIICTTNLIICAHDLFNLHHKLKNSSALTTKFIYV